MSEYRSTLRRGELPALRGQDGRIKSRPSCPPLYWHRVLIAGTSGNAFDVLTEMLLVGRDARFVAETARLVDKTHTTDGAPAEETRWRRLESGDLAAITLASEMSGMSGYRTMHGVSEPTSEPEATQKCQVVQMDSCTGRMGYVCEGFHIRKRFAGYPAPRDEKYVFEIELEPRSATYGLFNGDVLEVH